MSKKNSDKNESLKLPTIQDNSEDITFDSYDLLNLKGFAESLYNFIKAEHYNTEGSLVISLNAAFGSGKTCFLKMFENYLKAENHDVIYINSWKNDFFDEPIISIASEILNYLELNEETKDKVIEKLKLSLLEVIGSVYYIANGVIDKFAGIDLVDINNKVKDEIKNKDLLIGTEIYGKYTEQNNLVSGINELLKKYIESSGNSPLFIIIDELDRSRPDYSVKFLEVLKHLFENNNIVFILGVDKDHLKSSVQSLYGRNINFPEYYRKFVHRNVNLPTANEVNISNFISKKIERFFSIEKTDKAFVTKIDADRVENIKLLCKKMSLTPRQIDELFRLYSHFLVKKEGHNDGLIGWVLAGLVVSAISIKDEEMFLNLLRGNIGYSELMEFFIEKEIIDVEQGDGGFNNHWWAKFLFSVSLDRNNYDENISIYNEKLNLRINLGKAEDKHHLKRELSRYIPLANNHDEIGNEAVIKVVSRKISDCKQFYDR